MNAGEGTPSASRTLYERDIAAWAEEQARLIRTRNFETIDVENVTEEIEDLARLQRRELCGCLEVVLRQLVKWQFQPGHQCVAWKMAIQGERDEVGHVLAESPSLRAALPDLLPRAFRTGVTEVYAEFGIDHLPETCPWTIEQILSPEFLPD